MMKKIIALFLAISISNLIGFVAMASNTTLSEVVSAGNLTVASAGSAAFAGKTVTHAGQNDTTTFTTDPKDSRGSGAGWSTTMTATNLTTALVVPTAGTNTLSAMGYDGTYGVTTPVKKYNIVITTAGAVGTAVFQWRVDGGIWINNVVTATNNVLEKGLTLNFNSGTYALNDAWAIGVDVFPYTSLTVSPQTMTADVGVTTDMTAGNAGALAGADATSSSKTLLTAPSFRGMGDYAQTINLSQAIQANPTAGTYASLVIISII